MTETSPRVVCVSGVAGTEREGAKRAAEVLMQSCAAREIYTAVMNYLFPQSLGSFAKSPEYIVQ